MDKIDNYAHRLSIKNDICYESAYDLIKTSITRLNDYKYDSENLVRSAYKYSRHKLTSQEGGSSNTEVVLKYYLN